MMGRGQPDVGGKLFPTGLSALCATCLALMFGGIWISDNAALSLLEPPGSMLSVRLASLMFYVCALILCLRFEKRTKNNAIGTEARTKIVVALIATTTLIFLASSVFIALSADNIFRTDASLIPLILMKCVGVPLSISLMVLYARLPYRHIVSFSSAGFVGAFVLEQVSEALLPIGGTDNALILLGVGTVSVVLSCAMAAAMVTRAEKTDRARDVKRTGSAPPHDATRVDAARADAALLHDAARADTAPSHGAERADAASPHDATRADMVLHPLRKLMGLKMAAGIVVAAMMLGVIGIGPAKSDPGGAAVIAMVTIAVLAVWRSSSFGIHDLFRAALVSTAAGLIMAPTMVILSIDIDELLLHIGSMLFEIVVWAVSALVVRACNEPTKAAAAVRTAAVAGHFVGSAFATIAYTASQGSPEAYHAVSLVIVFIYFIALLYLFNDPATRLPFIYGFQSPINDRRGPIDSVEPIPTPRNASGIDTDTTSGKMRGSDPDRPVHDEKFWSLPCESLARSYGLTPRETEVLEQLAQGRDIAFLEERFILSRNTLKMHIKHIYAKLHVHSKQEVIDLVERERVRKIPE